MKLPSHAPRRLALALGLAAIGTAATSAAVFVGPQTLPAGTFERVEMPIPLRLAEGMSADATTSLSAAEVGAADQLAAMRAWNDAGQVPAKAGFHRTLVEPQVARLAPALWTEAVGRAAGGGWTALSPRGNLVWGTSVAVEGASRLRLHLTDVSLPEGTRLWVYGFGEEARAFDLEYLHPENGLWTPSILGDRIHLEVEIPEAARGGSWGFAIPEVSQIFDAHGTRGYLSPEASPEDCLEFGSCFDSTDFPGYEAAMHGVFQYIYEEGGSTWLCSGGLLNDTDPSTNKLWGLTANHCINSTAADNTVDPWYNYYFTGCPPTSIHFDQGPVGATIRVTRAIPDPDVTLMEMNDSGIDFAVALLGWTTAHVGPGITLHKLSHPYAPIPDSGDPDVVILPQMYSEHVSTENPDFLCEDGDGTIEAGEVTLANFIYTVSTLGTTVGGSSGSPILLPNGQVVGQLLGKCHASGPAGPDSCQYDEFNNLDGRFEQSFPYLSPFLTPGGGGSCTPDADTSCLLGERFRVEVQWTTIDDTGAAQVMSFGGERAESDQSVFFYFFNPENFEMGVKMVDACSFNDSFWVFISGLTNQAYVVTINDTQTGQTRQYSNPLGQYPQTLGLTDGINGFDCTPGDGQVGEPPTADEAGGFVAIQPSDPMDARLATILATSELAHEAQTPVTLLERAARQLMPSATPGRLTSPFVVVESLDSSGDAAAAIALDISAEQEALLAISRTPEEYRAALLALRAEQRRALELQPPVEIQPGIFYLATGTTFLIPHFAEDSVEGSGAAQSSDRGEGGER